MKANTCTIIVYTQTGAFSFEVVASGDNFEERLGDALEQGTVLLDTTDGGKLILCALNVVAIEVREAEEKSESNTPPVSKL